jgi:hypothetical protein
VFFCCRTPDVFEPSKAVEQKPSHALVLLSSGATAPNPSPSMTVVKGGTGLVVCDYADAGAYAQRVLQYLEHMKNMVDDREGNRSNFFKSLGCLYSF